MVTGAGRGMGAHIAESLSRYGADLIICSRTKTELDEVAEKIKANGRKVICYSIDLTQTEMLPRMVDECEGTTGRH